jgi:hypothetical protein
MDEAENSVLREQIATWYAREAYDDAEARARQEINDDAQEDDPWENSDYTIHRGDPWNADLDTVVVQLRTLGLIAKSERKRGVNDKGTYWTLTPYGDTHLTALRAIPRGRDLVERATGVDADTAEGGEASDPAAEGPQ